MAAAVITADRLRHMGRRHRILRMLAEVGPLRMTPLCREFLGVERVPRVERLRIRSALRDMKAARWIDGTNDGWALTPLGLSVLRELEARNMRAAA